METRECQVCRSIDPIYIHHIPHRGDFAFLCTPCVLRHHPGSFCPICFDVYGDSPNNRRPSADSRLMCHRCPAMAHLTCLPPTRPSRYLCPQCSDSPSDSSGPIEFSYDFAKKLLCAAKITALFMRRASAIAKANAELKVKAALLARRKADEAFERLGHLVVNQQSDNESEVDDGFYSSYWND
ncbi:hypothetical protein ACS0TY_005452 [Phlomoides rotata]